MTPELQAETNEQVVTSTEEVRTSVRNEKTSDSFDQLTTPAQNQIEEQVPPLVPSYKSSPAYFIWAIFRSYTEFAASMVGKLPCGIIVGGTTIALLRATEEYVMSRSENNGYFRGLFSGDYLNMLNKHLADGLVEAAIGGTSFRMGITFVRRHASTLKGAAGSVAGVITSLCSEIFSSLYTQYKDGELQDMNTWMKNLLASGASGAVGGYMGQILGGQIKWLEAQSRVGSYIFQGVGEVGSATVGTYVDLIIRTGDTELSAEQFADSLASGLYAVRAGLKSSSHTNKTSDENRGFWDSEEVYAGGVSNSVISQAANNDSRQEMIIDKTRSFSSLPRGGFSITKVESRSDVNRAVLRLEAMFGEIEQLKLDKLQEAYWKILCLLTVKDRNGFNLAPQIEHGYLSHNGFSSLISQIQSNDFDSRVLYCQFGPADLKRLNIQLNANINYDFSEILTPPECLKRNLPLNEVDRYWNEFKQNLLAKLTSSNRRFSSYKSTEFLVYLLKEELQSVSNLNVAEGSVHMYLRELLTIETPIVELDNQSGSQFASFVLKTGSPIYFVTLIDEFSRISPDHVMIVLKHYLDAVKNLPVGEDAKEQLTSNLVNILRYKDDKSSFLEIVLEHPNSERLKRLHNEHALTSPKRSSKRLANDTLRQLKQLNLINRKLSVSVLPRDRRSILRGLLDGFCYTSCDSKKERDAKLKKIKGSYQMIDSLSLSYENIRVAKNLWLFSLRGPENFCLVPAMLKNIVGSAEFHKFVDLHIDLYDVRFFYLNLSEDKVYSLLQSVLSQSLKLDLLPKPPELFRETLSKGERVSSTIAQNHSLGGLGGNITTALVRKSISSELILRLDELATLPLSSSADILKNYILLIESMDISSEHKEVLIKCVLSVPRYSDGTSALQELVHVRGKEAVTSYRKVIPKYTSLWPAFEEKLPSFEMLQSEARRVLSEVGTIDYLKSDSMLREVQESIEVELKLGSSRGHEQEVARSARISHLFTLIESVPDDSLAPRQKSDLKLLLLQSIRDDKGYSYVAQHLKNYKKNRHLEYLLQRVAVEEPRIFYSIFLEADALRYLQGIFANERFSLSKHIQAPVYAIEKSLLSHDFETSTVSNVNHCRKALNLRHPSILLTNIEALFELNPSQFGAILPQYLQIIEGLPIPRRDVRRIIGNVFEMYSYENSFCASFEACMNTNRQIFNVSMLEHIYDLLPNSNSSLRSRSSIIDDTRGILNNSGFFSSSFAEFSPLYVTQLSSEFVPVQCESSNQLREKVRACCRMADIIDLSSLNTDKKTALYYLLLQSIRDENNYSVVVKAWKKHFENEELAYLMNRSSIEDFRLLFLEKSRDEIDLLFSKVLEEDEFVFNYELSPPEFYSPVTATMPSPDVLKRSVGDDDWRTEVLENLERERSLHSDENYPPHSLHEYLVNLLAAGDNSIDLPALLGEGSRSYLIKRMPLLLNVRIDNIREVLLAYIDVINGLKTTDEIKVQLLKNCFEIPRYKTGKSSTQEIYFQLMRTVSRKKKGVEAYFDLFPRLEEGTVLRSIDEIMSETKALLDEVVVIEDEFLSVAEVDTAKVEDSVSGSDTWYSLFEGHSPSRVETITEMISNNRSFTKASKLSEPDSLMTLVRLLFPHRDWLMQEYSLNRDQVIEILKDMQYFADFIHQPSTVVAEELSVLLSGESRMVSSLRYLGYDAEAIKKLRLALLSETISLPSGLNKLVSRFEKIFNVGTA